MIEGKKKKFLKVSGEREIYQFRIRSWAIEKDAEYSEINSCLFSINCDEFVNSNLMKLVLIFEYLVCARVCWCLTAVEGKSSLSSFAIVPADHQKDVTVSTYVHLYGV